MICLQQSEDECLNKALISRRVQCTKRRFVALLGGVLSNGERLDKATVKLPDVAVQVSGLGEAPFTPLTGVRLLACVNHSVSTQVMGVLEALAALATGVWLFARVRALVAFECVHAGEGFVALHAGGD